MSKYDTDVDVDNVGTSHAIIVDLVGSNKRVLDVGCATGYLARVLRDRGCRVYGFEVDPEAAATASQYLEQVVVGDLDGVDLAEAFGDEKFDVVVFGDVLEHLRDPLPPLRAARAMLLPGGSVVVSVPNIAHGAVRLSLLRGEFTYRSLGLLDVTHLRFFTRDGLETLVRDAGFVMVDVRRTEAGLFETELGVRADDFDSSIIEAILEDRDATTYQFIVRAVSDDGDQAVLEMSRRVRVAEDDRHRLERELAQATTERAALESETVALRHRLESTEDELAALNATLSMRLLKKPRGLYERLRAHR